MRQLDGGEIFSMANMDNLHLISPRNPVRGKDLHEHCPRPQAIFRAFCFFISNFHSSYTEYDRHFVEDVEQLRK
jgi:hypothetical protein